ncbi:Tumour necrosis factor domain,Tumour necrosis factor-like domain,Tumour necrosis factor, conserved site [Cinara cedri]|uniref:Tumour necrosis factor domain,Tumour necrosis factor-like domain,Tumour necrosis factor, conserved site n=1 Tax=Cinara cedri TaxID=506608 RepID=A0A5E4NSA4_9HEMI|nr:Tumour necrosis factor domain,Tumour necrosis factor-like domain,Tumour necrosis factor, conserved site [Cinara cedri]
MTMMYNSQNDNGGGLTAPSAPPPPSSEFYRGKTPGKNAARAPASQPTAAVLAFTVLLCVFSCSLTVALSYKWYADVGRQINVLLGAVEDVTCEVNKFAAIIRDELVAKRLRNGDGRGGGTTTAKTSNVEYDDADDDYPDERFMGRDLSDNNWPSKTYRGRPSAVDRSVDEESREAAEDRRRRNAEVDARRAPVKNQLNGSNYDKSNVELLQDDANEENTVKTYSRRRPKKMQSRKKPAEDSSVSYESLREPQTAVAAHFVSDKSKYSTITHPHYDGNGRLRHPDGEFKDWTQYIWDNGEDNGANHFQIKNGKVDISKPGFYYVYAQVYYTDQHDINGFYVMKNNEKIFSCTTTRYQANQSDSCYTGGLIYFNSKDILSIKGLFSERYIYLDPVSSFFGLFLVSSKDSKR